MMREYTYPEKDADGHDTGFRLPYMNVFRINEDQNIRADLRITSGEKQDVFSDQTKKQTGFETGMIGETLFGDVFPDCILQREAYGKTNDDGTTELGKYAADCDYVFFSEKLKKVVRIDVKTRVYRNRRKNGKTFKYPASFFDMFIPKEKYDLVKNGNYKTDYYAFMGHHEERHEGYFFGLVKPEVFFQHAKLIPIYEDVMFTLYDSLCVPISLIYKLSEHEKIGLKPSFDFENKLDEECNYLIPQGTPFKAQVYENDQFLGVKEGHLKKDEQFNYNESFYEYQGDRKYTFRFHREDASRDRMYHLLIDRQYISHCAGV